ncbi:hypothetical protein HK104_001994, partial [Borealophlyctis nickersoniae]
MRLAILKTQDSLVDRIVSLPPPSDNVYINAFMSPGLSFQPPPETLSASASRTVRSPGRSQNSLAPPSRSTELLAVDEQRGRHANARRTHDPSVATIVPMQTTMQTAETRMTTAGVPASASAAAAAALKRKSAPATPTGDLRHGTGQADAAGGLGVEQRSAGTGSNSGAPAVPQVVVLPDTEAIQETLVPKGLASEVAEQEEFSSPVKEEPEEPVEQTAPDVPMADNATQEGEHMRRMAQIEMLKMRLQQALDTGDTTSEEQSKVATPTSDETPTSDPGTEKVTQFTEPLKGEKEATDSVSDAALESESSLSRRTSTKSRRRKRASSSPSKLRPPSHGSLENESLGPESIPNSLNADMQQVFQEAEEDDYRDSDGMSNGSHSSTESMHVEAHLHALDESEGETLALPDVTSEVVSPRLEQDALGDQANVDESHPPEALESVHDAEGGATSTYPKSVPDVQTQSGKTSVSGRPSEKLDNDVPPAPDTSTTPKLEDMFAKKEVPSLKDLKRMSCSSLLDLRPKSAGKGTVSALTRLINDKSGTDNPFTDYSFFSGKGNPDAIRLKIYVVLQDADSPDPLLISVKREATVEEVIGYALYEHCDEGREPPLPDHLKDVIMWNMRIVEDDGTVDDDFP